ncbi:MAG: hypothetical protein ACLGIF_08900, partial [Actinomycetes bacterium]
MAQKTQTGKPAGDPYAQRGKALTSTVQRLRGWVGSDPSRAPELADALVELTAHRLSGHQYASAATDAQEAVRRAAQQLTANGPIGPYTSAPDAARYLTAVVHLAAIQVGLGLTEAAGRTLDSLGDMLEQLRGLRLEAQLSPPIPVWALAVSARAALTAGEVGAANAYADAALARLATSGLRDAADVGYLAIDVDRVLADARCAAGHVEDSLAHLHAAQHAYEDLVDRRLREPMRLSPALLERLAEPLFGLYRDLADRLYAAGEVDLGLGTRRQLIDLLRDLAGRWEPARGQSAQALVDLADDLLGLDRVAEAEAAAGEALALLAEVTDADAARLRATATRARVLTRTGRAGEAVRLLRQSLPADPADPEPAVHALALRVLAEAQLADGDPETAAATEARLAEAARGLAAGTGDSEVSVHDAARGVVSRGVHQITWAPLPADAPYAAGADLSIVASLEDQRRAETVKWLRTHRSGAQQQERDRREEADAAA